VSHIAFEEKVRIEVGCGLEGWLEAESVNLVARNVGVDRTEVYLARIVALCQLDIILKYCLHEYYSPSEVLGVLDALDEVVHL